MWQLSIDGCDATQQEALIGVLDQAGCEGFWEDGEVLHAYWESAPPQDPVALVQHHYPALRPLLVELPPQNWNARWEAEYTPVHLPGICQVLAPGHPVQEDTPCVIRIHPQMTFGTGHHETTRLMLGGIHRLLSPHTEAQRATHSVLDMGCGTGVLGIYALLKGAGSCTFVDIDPTAAHNTTENLKLNHLPTSTRQQPQVTVRAGDAALLPQQPTYHLILANIARNILLADGQRYLQCLQPGGQLLLSGFLDFDSEAIITYFRSLGMHQLFSESQSGWQCLCFERT